MYSITNPTEKEKALAKFLYGEKYNYENVEEARELIENEYYLVLDDLEATEEAKIRILNSAWAFQPWFLMNNSSSMYKMGAESLTKWLSYECESANDAVLDMLDDKDSFVENAISADGRGHFISSYNGYEDEQDGFFIYRMN